MVAPQLELQPAQLTSNSILIVVPSQICVFGIPAEFTLKECLEDIKNRFGLQSLPEGTFKCERSLDHIFEYLEVQLDI